MQHGQEIEPGPTLLAMTPKGILVVIIHESIYFYKIPKNFFWDNSYWLQADLIPQDEDQTPKLHL
jgi:hypothetical protein